LIEFKDGYFERDVILLDCLLACAVSNICRQLEEMVEDAMWRMTTAHRVGGCSSLFRDLSTSSARHVSSGPQGLGHGDGARPRR